MVAAMLLRCRRDRKLWTGIILRSGRGGCPGIARIGIWYVGSELPRRDIGLHDQAGVIWGKCGLLSATQAGGRSARDACPHGPSPQEGQQESPYT